MRNTEITPKVRKIVQNRDSFDGWACCIVCGSPYSIEIHHFVERSRGGLGIEENLICLCTKCHRKLHDTESKEMKEFIKSYLEYRYPEWDEEKLILRSKS